MAKIQIIINQAGKPSGTPGVSREDIAQGVPVILTNNDNVGATKWRWSFISVPVNQFGISSASIITGAATNTATFTPDIDGTYIIGLTINDRIIGTTGVAIISAGLTTRFPGIKETNEFGESGWGTAMGSFMATVESFPLASNIAGGDLDGYYPNPDVIGMVETDGPTDLVIGGIPDGYYIKRDGYDIIGSKINQITESDGPTDLSIGGIPDQNFLFRDGNNVSGGFPPLQNCYDSDGDITISSAIGAIQFIQFLQLHREFDFANAILRMASIESAISGQIGIDMDGYADHDFACMNHRCKINTVAIPENMAGNVVAGVLTIIDPCNLASMSVDLLLYVQLFGDVNGLFRFQRTGAAVGNIYDLDNDQSMPDGNCVATFYYPRFHVGANTDDSTFMGPGPSRVNMLTFGGFGDTGSSVGHLHYVYADGGPSNELYTRRAMTVDGINAATDIAYETATGEYHSQRIITGVSPSYSHATAATMRVKNNGAGPSVQADDYVYDSEIDGYLWVDLMASSRIGVGANDDWTFMSDLPADISDNLWDGSMFESMQIDGYQVLECNDWPEGMKLNFIEVDWWSNIGLGRGVQLFATRQLWPTSSGDQKSNLRLNSSYTSIRHIGDNSRRWDYFMCDQDNLDWEHERNKLVIILQSGETGIGERVYGIRLNVSYRSVGKFNTNLSTNPV